MRVMRCLMMFVAALALGGMALPQKRQTGAAQPRHFEIGRLTFFDFGPPFDFYEVFIVIAEDKGASVERITLTPPAGACVQPAAEIESASGTTSESVTELLGIDPCTIPEKALRREQKRSKKYMTFSGAEVALQVQCGPQTRIIHSDILDRDWFNASAGTPEHTSRTMRLLEQLDHAVGPGVMDRPIFAASQEGKRAQGPESAAMRDLGAGRYDALFKKARAKLSELYRSAHNPTPGPAIRLLSSTPFQPEILVLPVYPQMARIAHLTGPVAFKVGVNQDGTTADISFESGHPLLQNAVREAVSAWRFSKDASGKHVQATIDFQCFVEIESDRLLE